MGKRQKEQEENQRYNNRKNPVRTVVKREKNAMFNCPLIGGQKKRGFQAKFKYIVPSTLTKKEQVGVGKDGINKNKIQTNKTKTTH